MDGGEDIQKMIAGMNSHLPPVRRTLLDYSENGNLFYKTREGTKVEFDSEEIDFLLEICDEIEKIRLKLPIIVSTDASGETSAWKVDGILESAVVAKILGKTKHREDMLRLYFPDLQTLRKKLPNAVIVAFV